jgi:hypothetical protein
MCTDKQNVWMENAEDVLLFPLRTLLNYAQSYLNWTLDYLDI